MYDSPTDTRPGEGGLDGGPATDRGGGSKGDRPADEESAMIDRRKGDEFLWIDTGTSNDGRDENVAEPDESATDGTGSLNASEGDTADETASADEDATVTPEETASDPADDGDGSDIDHGSEEHAGDVSEDDTGGFFGGLRSKLPL